MVKFPSLPVKPDLSRIRDWLNTGPNAIAAYPGEREIMRTGSVLVTNKRLAYIDAFDRTLKTYSFEHMIRLDKKYYRPNALNRRLCKGLILAAIITLLLIFILDITGNNDRALVLAYLPAFLSLAMGFFVWRDMRPRFAVEWEMVNGTTGRMEIEPLIREWISGNHKRERFMDQLCAAMNEALSEKAWWPNRHSQQTQLDLSAAPIHSAAVPASPAARANLQLVTDDYRH